MAAQDEQVDDEAEGASGRVLQEVGAAAGGAKARVHGGFRALGCGERSCAAEEGKSTERRAKIENERKRVTNT